jgi:hypothetical protein
VLSVPPVPASLPLTSAATAAAPSSIPLAPADATLLPPAAVTAAPLFLLSALTPPDTSGELPPEAGLMLCESESTSRTRYWTIGGGPFPVKGGMVFHAVHHHRVGAPWQRLRVGEMVEINGQQFKVLVAVLHPTQKRHRLCSYLAHSADNSLRKVALSLIPSSCGPVIPAEELSLLIKQLPKMFPELTPLNSAVQPQGIPDPERRCLRPRPAAAPLYTIRDWDEREQRERSPAPAPRSSPRKKLKTSGPALKTAPPMVIIHGYVF